MARNVKKSKKWKNFSKTTISLNPVKIRVLYQNRFFYKIINKTYFDYLDYSVKDNEKYKDNYKKCGILDTKNNILCMLIDEECPLNDIQILDNELPGLLSQYSYIKTIESLTD